MHTFCCSLLLVFWTPSRTWYVFLIPRLCDSFVSSKTYGGGSVCEALVGDVYDLGLEACHYGLGFEYSCAQTGKYCLMICAYNGNCFSFCNL